MLIILKDNAICALVIALNAKMRVLIAQNAKPNCICLNLSARRNVRKDILAMITKGNA